MIYLPKTEKRRRSIFLREDVYKLDCTAGAYAYAVTNEHGVTLIDANYPEQAEAMLSELAAAGLGKVDRLLLTHLDGDHIGGAAAIQQATGCNVYASARELETMDDPKKNKSYGHKPTVLLSSPQLTALAGDDVAGIKILPAYGHTWGHTCFLWGDVLFVGDLAAVEQGLWKELDLVYIRDYAQSRRAIQKISAIGGFTLVCPAHGEPLECREITVP